MRRRRTYTKCSTYIYICMDRVRVLHYITLDAPRNRVSFKLRETAQRFKVILSYVCTWVNDLVVRRLSSTPHVVLSCRLIDVHVTRLSGERKE